MGSIKIPDDPERIAANRVTEKALLGGLLLQPEIIPEVATVLVSEHFYDPLHGRIYDAILHQWREQKPVDFITILDRLGNVPFEVFGQLRDAGLPGHVEYYARIIVDCANRRHVKNILQEAMESLGTYDADLVANFQNMSSEVIEKIGRQSVIRPIRDTIIDTIKEIQRSGGLQRARTGLTSLDQITGGMQPGHVWIIAGRTSMGKSALAQTVILNIAKQGYHAGYFCIEGDANELQRRLLSIESQVPLKHIADSSVDLEECAQVTEAHGRINSMNIYAFDGITQWDKLKSHIQILKIKHPDLAAVFLDHMSYIRHTRYKNRWENMAEISKEFKSLCVQLKICGVMICQINRETEKRKDHRPNMGDLRESGSVEEDADNIVLIYRPGQYSDKFEKSEAHIAVAKQRNGPTGCFECLFDAECVTFKDEY